MRRNTKSHRRQALDYAEKAYDIIGNKLYYHPEQDPFRSTPALREKIEDHLQIAIDLLRDGVVGSWAAHRRPPLHANSRRSSRRRTSRRS